MSVTHPALLFGGALLVLVPIIIHLLNKRKFKIVDWAAMDFLFEADKKNRRRVRLEDLLILLLRVLAVLLLAALFARPFLSSASASVLGGKVGFERIVLLDDSPSMEARQQGAAGIQQARRMLADLVRELGTHHSSDTLTVLVTSRPRAPVVREAVLSPETVSRLSSELGSWPVSHRAAHYEESLAEVEKQISAQTTNLNRIVYVISDLRGADWHSAQQPGSPTGPVALLRRLADKTSGCYLVNVGGPQAENLAITSLVPLERLLAAGQTCRFEVTVHNFGPADVKDVTVKVTPEGSLPIEGQLDRVPAGKPASLPVSVTFAHGDSSESVEPVAIRAELVLPSSSADDRMTADNVRYFPARVVSGIQTLIVDGDPTADPRRAETFYLRRSLAPPGDSRSGILTRVVAPSEFETLDLDAFQVVFLANVDRLSDTRRSTLEQWVRRGGGLVIALGDQLADLGWFNSKMFQGGKGLAPAEVLSIQGDENRRKWALFDIVSKGHEVVSIYEGENNPFLEGVKVFRWWQCKLPDTQVQTGQTRLLARLTDSESSPVVIEHTFGDGRVMLLTTPVDADWNTWPQDHHSYVLFMQFLSRYMAHSTARAGLIEIGQPIKVALDLVRHKVEATLIRPSGEQIGLHPVQDPPASVDPKKEIPSSGASDSVAAEASWRVSTGETDTPGFYRVNLTLHGGAAETVLFAANLAAEESNLAAVEAGELKQQLQGSRVEMIEADALLAVQGDVAKAEWWLFLLGGLGIVLGAEQALAWLFGRRR